MLQKSIPLLLIVFSLVSCGGTICKGKTNKGEERTVVFHYDPILQTVNVGGAPTYVKKYEWVKKLIVQTDGFIVVNSQMKAGFKKLPCDQDKTKLCEKHTTWTDYDVQSYTEKGGYKYWFDVPKKDWMPISKLGDEPPQAPYLQAKDCRYSLFGAFLELVLAIFFA